MPRGRPRKTRVTKEEIKKVREAKKESSYKSKKKIVPGPWTSRKTKIKKVNIELKESSGIMSDILGKAYGNYTNDILDGQKGWYSIVFNIQVDAKMIALIKKHGIDDFLAACEKSMTEKLDKSGKSKYGTVIFLNLSVDNSKDKGFISIRAKTNKKSISGFRAVRKGEYIVLP